jgi:hypothetical protein
MAFAFPFLARNEINLTRIGNMQLYDLMYFNFGIGQSLKPLCLVFTA